MGFGRVNDLAEKIHENAKAKGFHEYVPEFGKAGRDARHILSWLMLVTTEVAEAAEAVRLGDKVNFAEELADICIRVFDVAEALGVNIEQEIVNKMVKNVDRGIRHNGKLA
ncbi:MAG: MazG nucleotide pyrophosphohydrolase domain-containing protein [Gaiellaceae bacterium]